MNSPALPSYSKAEKSAFPYLFTLLFLIAFVDSWRRAEVSPLLFLEAEGRNNLWKFLTGMFPPDLSTNFLGLMFRPAMETIQISVMGTLIAIVMGFPLGMLGTKTFSASGVLNEVDTLESPTRRARGYLVYFGARAMTAPWRRFSRPVLTGCRSFSTAGYRKCCPILSPTLSIAGSALCALPRSWVWSERAVWASRLRFRCGCSTFTKS